MVGNLVENFVSAIIEHTDYADLDRLYLANRIYALVGDSARDAESSEMNPITMKNELLQLGVKHGFIEDVEEEREIVGSQLMDLLTPSPSQVNRAFWETYRLSPQEAIRNFYTLSQNNDYIKTDRIAKNIAYTTQSPYGNLEITINLSKPEKDPKAIAAAKLLPSSDFPKCLLCMENEGYLGRLNHPARSNHRIIRFEIDQREWGFQYSPYAYFKEHAIFFLEQHQPMEISNQTFANLLSIVETFPGYFAGSNADLPIVGGSILTHEHYQGGRHTFPMETANLVATFQVKGFSDVEAGILHWPMSVIRLRSQEKDSLIALASKILSAWRSYSDDELGISSESEGIPHHTITPIARKKGAFFECDLVLRNNQTSEEFPDGIYHPHPDVQHIKQENIGLIEVMGLAILPPRLKTEFQTVKDYLLGKVEAVNPIHQVWADELKEKYPDVHEGNVEAILRQAVGDKFTRVLEDAGVFKQDEIGQAAFHRFVESLGVEEFSQLTPPL
ncbi:UDP-glucose--hexose-1-phosphate uridylyltransferase [Streptococcus sp. 10F2]